MSQGRLIILCGLPGSGKTTLAKRLEVELGAVRFCPDDWFTDLQLDIWDEALRSRIEALQWRLGCRLLALGQTVIIEWGTWAREERDALREGARSLSASAELRYLSAPLDELMARIERRGLEDPPLTRAHLEQYQGQFQAPTDDEMALYDSPGQG